MSDSLQPYGLWPTRFLCPWDFPGKKPRSGLPWPPPGDLLNLGIEPTSLSLLHWQVGSLPLVPRGEPWLLPADPYIADWETKLRVGWGLNSWSVGTPGGNQITHPSHVTNGLVIFSTWNKYIYIYIFNFFLFYFIFKLHIIVLVLPNIKMILTHV